MRFVPTIADDLAGVVRLGLVEAAPVTIAPTGAALEAEFGRTVAALVSQHAGLMPSEIEGLEPARRLYRAFGIDPTRTRPSSEALLRRVLKGQPIPRILNAVDLCNLCALRCLLPIGLYDADTIHGGVVLRRGKTGERYTGARKDDVHLEGRPVLADGRGPFGNPTADSLRTAVTPATRSLWMVVFAPRDVPGGVMTSRLEEARRLMQEHLGPRDAPAGGAVTPVGVSVMTIPAEGA